MRGEGGCEDLRGKLREKRRERREERYERRLSNVKGIFCGTVMYDGTPGTHCRPLCEKIRVSVSSLPLSSSPPSPLSLLEDLFTSLVPSGRGCMTERLFARGVARRSSPPSGEVVRPMWRLCFQQSAAPGLIAKQQKSTPNWCHGRALAGSK